VSFDRLQKKIDEMKNPTVVGLDPALEYIPRDITKKHIDRHGETLEAAAGAVCQWGMGLIDVLYDIVPAIKPQLAYYEALGPYGLMALKTICDYAKGKSMYVIFDGKRNDISTTAEAYSAAYLGTVTVGGNEIFPFDADALTVNAYLGSDCIRPFIKTAVKYDKAVFALVKTSNPSAGELQDLVVIKKGMQGKQGIQVKQGQEDSEGSSEQTPNLYTTVGELMEEISRETIGKCGYSRVGAVIGATYPEEIEFLRKRLSSTFFLIPGYGAQGGSADSVAGAFDKDGHGAIINASRSIRTAWEKTGGHYTDAARREAIRMRDEILQRIMI